ncbi:MAG: zinc ribbon domain-containing protein [Oscillospiraceae bacterium]|nr:zinc ribbon domain-containing protein [Oscillospiraceae bacterium]
MFCRKCGSELPDGTGICPNCGRMNKAKPINAASLSIEKPANKVGGRKNFVVIAAVSAAVLAIAALVAVLIIYNQPRISPNSFNPNTILSGGSVSGDISRDTVKIKLNLSVEQNDFFAKYGVDVVINGVTVKTINQGETFEREIEVEKGSFTIKFVKNRSSSDETLNFSSDTVEPAEYTEYVDRDCTITLKIKTHKLSIEIV